MVGFLEAVVPLAMIAVVLRIGAAALLGGLHEWRSWRFVAGHLRRPAPAAMSRRPLEQIADDALRLSASYHRGGMRFAQYEGRRQAYDKVLAEAADAVRIDHLLGVLAPGPELDAERTRVEAALVEAGVLPRPAEPY